MSVAEIDGIERKARRRDEEQLQRSIVAYLEMAALPNVIWEAVNSGGFKLGRAAAGRQKGMGIRKGSPDLHFVLADGTAAFMELKRPGGKQSPEQQAYQTRCITMGIPYVVVTSLDTAIEIFKAWRVVR